MTQSSPAPVVVDASAAVELLTRTTAAGRIEDRLARGVPVAPAHLDAEVLSALFRLARRGAIDEALAGRAVTALARAPIRRYPLAPLLPDAWSMRANVAARDAVYVALARRLGAPLLTADGRLARAPDIGIGVELVGS